MDKGNNQWEVTTLGDICRRGGGFIQTGPFGSQLHASDYVEDGIPTIMPKNIGENKVNEDDLSRVAPNDVERLRKYKVQTGDIVYSRRGDVTLRALIREQQNGWLCGTGSLMIRLGKGIADPKFVSYYLGTTNAREWIQNHAVGATMPNLNTSIMSAAPIAHPPLPEQQKIAAVLSALDAKIELNQRINAELESIAKTLYDYWFVQFDFPNEKGKPYKSFGGKMVWNDELKREIPLGWEVGRIGEFGEFKNGINYDPSIQGDVDAKIINIRNMSSSKLFVSQHELDTITLEKKNVDKYLVTDNDILIARSGIPGATRIMFEYAENTIYCGFIIRFQVNNVNNKNYLLYFLKGMEKNSKSSSGGTIMPNINQETLKRMVVLMPNEQIISKFNSFISPIFEQINSKAKETQTLTELRDWLLPILMNGQVKVN